MTAATLTGSVPLSRRQLAHKRGRTLAGVAGIGLALLLVLALNAIFAGMEERLTAYIDRSGADVIVSQEGVRTMHMTQSALPEKTVAAVAALPGVAAAEGVLYVAGKVERDERAGIAYVIGDDRGGASFPLVSGRRPAAGEIVLDRVLAERLGVGVGGTVSVFGRPFKVAGQVSGLTLITSSFAFVRRADLAPLLRSEGVVNYVLVRAHRGADPGELAARLERRLPVTASTRQRFAASERSVVGDMSTDIVRGMTVVGFVVGIAVAGLVAYSSTSSQLRDWGVLRAIGLTARRAVALVAAQVGLLVGGGFAVALALVFLLATTAPRLSPTLVLDVRPGDVAKAGLVAAVVALVAALVPVVRVARVEPASVFRRSS